MAEKKKVEVDKKALKAATVEDITGRLRQASTAVLADYRGMTVAQMQELRRKLRAGGVEMLVVKNTLARRAASAAGLGVLEKELTGPVAMIFGKDDPSTPARLLNEFVRANRKMVIKSAILQGRLLDAETVVQLADLPPRAVLLSRLLGAMQAPLSNLASVLQAPVGQLARTLDALRMQKEKTEPPATAPAPAG